jgi:hypothetical protein
VGNKPARRDSLSPGGFVFACFPLFDTATAICFCLPPHSPTNLSNCLFFRKNDLRNACFLSQDKPMNCRFLSSTFCSANFFSNFNNAASDFKTLFFSDLKFVLKKILQKNENLWR